MSFDVIQNIAVEESHGTLTAFQRRLSGGDFRAPFGTDRHLPSMDMRSSFHGRLTPTANGNRSSRPSSRSIARKVIPYDHDVKESLPALSHEFPRYICFVAQPTEATAKFVADVNRLTRQLDDDPYTDAIWGILTGYDAKCALRIATLQEPLVIHRVAAATEVELGACDEGIWYSELTRGKMVRKTAGKEPHEESGPDDSTKALVDRSTTTKRDLFVTSGHASERDWRIGFSYPNGDFRSSGGQLYGIDTKGQKFPGPLEESEGLLAGRQLPDGAHRRPGCDGPGVYE